MTLLPDWKDILKHAWSVRMLALLAVLDFVAAAMIFLVDGAFASLIADHTIAVVLALVVKSLLSVFGIVLRVKVQKEAEEYVEEVAA